MQLDTYTSVYGVSRHMRAAVQEIEERPPRSLVTVHWQLRHKPRIQRMFSSRCTTHVKGIIGLVPESKIIPLLASALLIISMCDIDDDNDNKD